MNLNEDNSDNEIKRILSFNNKDNPNPYEILAISYLSTEEEIKRKYRTLAIIVHPDKCENIKASEAFNLLENAYKNISDPEKKIFYKRLINTAKERVQIKRNEINKERTKKGLPLLPEDTYEDEIRDMVNKILREIEEKRQYEIETKFNNKKRERELEEEAKKKEEENKLITKEKDKYIDKGVRNWNRFKQRAGKKINIMEIKPRKYKAEVRNNENGIVIYQENSII